MSELTVSELERVAEALRRADFMNWTAAEVAVKIQGTIAAITERRLEWAPAAPNPDPETSPADDDDDRLATELFRRYGSVERGLYRGREHWVADADAIRQLITAEQLVRVSVHAGPDPDTRAAIWNEGFDEAWEQADGEWIAGAFAGGIASAAFGLLVGWLVGRRGRS